MRKASLTASAEEKKKGISGGRKTLVFFGILFLVIGVFLGSFACSFQVMIQAANSTRTDDKTLQSENEKLKGTILLLQDQISILEAEKGKLAPSAGPTPSASATAPSATAKPKSSASTSTSSGSSPKSTTSATKKPTESNSSTSASAKPTTTNATGTSNNSTTTGTTTPAATNNLTPRD